MIRPLRAPDPPEVAAHYDELDRFYREIWGEHVHHGLWLRRGESSEQAVRNLIDAVVECAAICPGQSVCDVGCGYGGTARVLARDYGAEVTALTVSAAQHDYARALDPEGANPTYLLRDWMANDLPGSRLDAVISIESSEHMPDLARFFAEAARVLKPGGRLVVCAWLAAERPRAWEVRHLLEPICREGRHVGLGTVRDYERLARDAGLTPLGFRDLSRRVGRTWTLCIARGVRGLIERPDYRRFLLGRENPNRIFAWTMVRIRLAYALGSMRYGILPAEKPG
jgi:tocopherol O-methyltransferase